MLRVYKIYARSEICHHTNLLKTNEKFLDWIYRNFTKRVQFITKVLMHIISYKKRHCQWKFKPGADPRIFQRELKSKRPLWTISPTREQFPSNKQSWDLSMLYASFNWNWQSGSEEGKESRLEKFTEGQTDARRQTRTRAFSSDELKFIGWCINNIKKVGA